MAKRRLLGVLVAATSMAGCSLAPAYHPPLTPAPAAFKEDGPWTPARPADLESRGNWWSLYDDTTLDRLELKIDGDNPTLASALARYDQASAYLHQSHAGLLPSIGASADSERSRQSDTRPLRGSNQPDVYGAATTQAGFSYELDLWGRVRNSVAAGKAEAAASADDVAAVRLSLEAQLADSYVALRGYDQQIGLLSATVDAYTKADAMTERRFLGGIASGIDTSRSGTQLAEAQAQLADVRAARALTEHAIASLVGTPASGFAIASSVARITRPTIPAGLPATLLERRPDVAAAERRMAAANSGIGVAKAAFFPAITLGGQGGYQSGGVPGLFSAPNTLWSIGPGAVLNLFDGGRRRAQLAIARAAWSETTAAYRSQVLRAFQEVEDSLAELHHLGDEARAEDRAVQQAGQTEALSLNRYVKGAVTYLDVVTAQTTALRTRREALNLETRQLQASIGLIRATGGGWNGSAEAVAADRSTATR